MGVKVAAAAAAATTCFQWSHPVIPHSQTLASASSSRRRGRSDAGALACRYVDPFTLFGVGGGSHSITHHLHRSRTNSLKRSCTASLDAAFSDEEFSKKIQELALRFQLSDDNSSTSSIDKLEVEEEEEEEKRPQLFSTSLDSSLEPPWLQDEEEIPPDYWTSERDVIIPANIERKANSVELPVSLRMIKRKIQWREGFREAGESAYCSVKKAFSSMVFIIRELHSYTLQMRELLFTEDLKGILNHVQKEMNASFVWLFQQVFSHTPTLMMYVMLLLANFTVYSMGSNAAIAASPPLLPPSTETVSVLEIQENNQKFDSSSVVKTFSVSSSSSPSSSGKSTSIGGNNGGGGDKIRPFASGTDGGDGWLDGSNQFRTVVPDGVSQLSSTGTTGEAAAEEEEEMILWNSTVEEAKKMAGSLDHQTMQRFVSPIKANVEPDDYADYFRTELLYQTGLSQDPNNSLLLSNYAQFLYIVAQDYDRAEEYFKRAIAVEPPDAEAYSKYASFLWRVRNDLWAAEETFLEAINADPTNAYYAGNYAHFLWNTGGEDTCFPLNSQEDDTQQL